MDLHWIAKFWQKVDRTIGLGPNGDCHEWKNALTDKGYGRAHDEDRNRVRAHRLAWFLATGEWPSENLLHECDNRKCVRFEHLRDSSQADNIRDMLLKGRDPRVLPPDTIREIRRLLTQRPDLAWRKFIARSFGIGISRVHGIAAGNHAHWLPLKENEKGTPEKWLKGSMLNFTNLEFQAIREALMAVA